MHRYIISNGHLFQFLNAETLMYLSDVIHYTVAYSYEDNNCFGSPTQVYMQLLSITGHICVRALEG